MKNLIIQQGDCLLKSVGAKDVFTKEYSSIPKTAKPVKTNLVLKGTNNSHALYGGKFTILKDIDGTIFVKVTKKTTLDHVQDHTAKNPKHAEHHAQTIEIGEYFLSPVLEYDHQLEESRQIID
jgi:hypothetical protein